MNGLSPWAISASKALMSPTQALFEAETDMLNFMLYSTVDSLWILGEMPEKNKIAFRAVFCPGGSLKMGTVAEIEGGVEVQLSSDLGRYCSTITWDKAGATPVLHYYTTFTPDHNALLPFSPRDILVLGTGKGPEKETEGTVYESQWGTRTGFVYFSTAEPHPLTVLYIQNLTSLADYNQQTKTSAGDTVGGQWPELGFALPVADENPLEAGKKIIISDAYVAFEDTAIHDEPTMIRLYLDMLARIYLLLPRPVTNYQPWPDILDNGLKDLITSPGCWVQMDGHRYLNAYVSDYDTPPEIMVQLAVLLPLLDYAEWSSADLEIIETIKGGLPAFFDEKLGTINRWLPAAEDKLTGEEEQKHPGVMDSWYLHHPLLNLSRLALKDDKVAGKLLLDSLDYVVKVADHFKYQWPVFYKMDTLEVLKAETAEGKGGEKDVAGIYAHVMLQAWELTGEQRFLKEAETAAKTLKGKGFKVFYQANNTAFSSGALLRLYKITGNQEYLDLSYMCLAGVLRNTQIWDCNYGYGENFPRFFALYPLNDAPYTAAYEEQEVFCALHDYLHHADGVEILPSIRLLLAEYIRYMVDRAAYYYPTMLPEEMLEQDPKVGELDRNLWIALEDLQDGWLKSGTVGQEVYGAGNAFGILPRHYINVPEQDFKIYVDYPTSGIRFLTDSNIQFNVLGDDRLTCRLMIIKGNQAELPKLSLSMAGNKEITGEITKEGNLNYEIQGDQRITISWETGENKNSNNDQPGANIYLHAIID
jgi:hypothetical protein